MCLAYYLAKKIQIETPLPSHLLVLATGNLDECVVGYYSKFDCSSADLNPIASLTKLDIRSVLTYLSEKKGMRCWKAVLVQAPTAELRLVPKEGEVS